LIYFLARVFAYIVLVPLFFLRVKGRKNSRLEGGVVVIANHRSNWDPIVLGHSITSRPVCYMAKEELYRNKVARWFLLKLHSRPVARNKGDLVAIKTAIKALKEGKMLGIFPEGTRSKAGKMLPFQKGAALMALKAGVPVLPVYIEGGYKPFHRVTVHIGEPVDLKQAVDGKVTGDTIVQGTEYLEKVMAEMEQACKSE